MAIHKGSWGLPEFGVTEFIQKVTGLGGTTGEGGSDLSATIGTSNINNPQSSYSQSVADAAARTYSTPTSTTTPKMSYPQPMSVDSGVDLSNPVKKTEYAQSQGYDTWDQFQDSLKESAYTGPTEEELNEYYKPAYDRLKQAENILNTNKTDTLGLIDQQQKTSQGLLDTQKGSALGLLSEQDIQATQRKEDAMAAARRLYNELQMANQQRFGGASSAGLAASELQGRELMQNRASLTRDYNNAMRQIETSRADVENQYQQGLQQLETRKQEAVLKVTQDFNSKLLEIQNNKSLLDQDKAQARLESLMQMRDRIFQINLEDYNFKQQLAAQKSSYDSQLSAYEKAVLNQTNLAQDATSGFISNNPASYTTNFGVGGGTATAGSPILRGQINQIRGYDDYGNEVFPTVTTPQVISRDLMEGTYQPGRLY